tara:strand:+ start:2563 stop:2976 length:414 start_codon:yes stop_codon:yes gene_type:complete
MNMTYDEKNKEVKITWRTDTEHLEGAIQAHLKNSKFILTDSTSSSVLTGYINDNVNLNFNGKNQNLRVDIVESTFAETIIHFKPIKCRRKLKTVSMENSLLQAQFPNQKNMVQINYKGEMYSMLLGGVKVYEEVAIH